MKPSLISDELRAMIELRHSAEQRGLFDPIGQLLRLHTEHGVIQFPVVNGEASGPELGIIHREEPIPNDSFPSDKGTVFFNPMHHDALALLGPWRALPQLRTQTTKRCTKCLHDCDLCDGSGKKNCEGYQCGGRGWVPGPFQLCPAPGCSKETGSFNPQCTQCMGSGQVVSQVICGICKGVKAEDGFTKMICPRCRGTRKFATGRLHGSIDWAKSPECPACIGSGYQGKFVVQNLKQFTNAKFLGELNHGVAFKSKKRGFLALGPIHSFDVIMRGTPKAYRVEEDSMGDLLFLFVPASKQAHPQKAYLVGGVVKEVVAQQGVSA